MPVILSSGGAVVDDGFPLDVDTVAVLGESGITLGNGSETDAYGCRWKWAPDSAWGAKPAPRVEATDRPYGHGQNDSTRYYGPRVQSIPGTVRAPSHAALHAAKQRLFDAITVEPFRLRIIEPGFDGYAMVRQEGDVLWTEDGSPSFPHATFSIGLYAADPLIYSSREQSFGPLAFPTRTGGLMWPAVWPAIWDTQVVSGEAQLSNPGSVDAPLMLKLTGPARTVTIALPDLGESLTLADPGGAPILTAGQFLTVDCRHHLVMLMGDSSRRSWVQGRPSWLKVPAGGDTTRLAISGTGVTPVTVSGTQVSPTVSGTYQVARL